MCACVCVCVCVRVIFVAGPVYRSYLVHVLLLQTNDPEFDKLWAEIDPNETGYVSFEAFLAFMSKTVVDQDTADQVLESFKVLAGDKV